MCLSCGCKKVDDDHGDKRNITTKTLEEAGAAANISAENVVRNIDQGMSAGAGKSGQGGAALAEPRAVSGLQLTMHGAPAEIPGALRYAEEDSD